MRINIKILENENKSKNIRNKWKNKIKLFLIKNRNKL